MSHVCCVNLCEVSARARGQRVVLANTHILCLIGQRLPTQCTHTTQTTCSRMYIHIHLPDSCMLKEAILSPKRRLISTMLVLEQVCITVQLLSKNTIGGRVGTSSCDRCFGRALSRRQVQKGVVIERSNYLIVSVDKERTRGCVFWDWWTHRQFKSQCLN